jgi:hypothetical protein
MKGCAATGISSFHSAIRSGPEIPLGAEVSTGLYLLHHETVSVKGARTSPAAPEHVQFESRIGFEAAPKPGDWT